MSWSKWFLTFQRLVVRSEHWRPFKQRHSSNTILIPKPAFFQVILQSSPTPTPHPPPLFSLGSVLCFHYFVFSSSVCFRDIYSSGKIYIGVIIECSAQMNRGPDKLSHWKVKPIFVESESYNILFNLFGTAAEIGLQICETFCLWSYKVTYLWNEMKYVSGTEIVAVFHRFHLGHLISFVVHL